MGRRSDYPHRNRMSSVLGAISATGLLLLLAVERKQSDARHLHHLESHTRDIAHSVALTAEPSDQHLVVLIDEVEATVTRHESGDLLAVFDQLSAHALADGRVGLLGLDANFLQDDALAVRRAAEGIALELRAEVALFVRLVGPPVLYAHGPQLARSVDSAGLSGTHDASVSAPTATIHDAISQIMA